MEDKLAKYRAEKAAEFAQQHSKDGNILVKTWQSLTGTKRETKDNTKENEIDKDEDEEETQTFNISRKLNERVTYDDYGPIPTHIKVLKASLWLILWLIFWHLFIELGFGAVYFIVTASYMMYISMRSGRNKAPDEPSAYSVFNPNCERIQGTFAAEKPGDFVF